jgi:hypothetical protein
MHNEDFNRALEQILKLTAHALFEFKQTAPNSNERIFWKGQLVALNDAVEVFAQIDRVRLRSKA